MSGLSPLLRDYLATRLLLEFAVQLLLFIAFWAAIGCDLPWWRVALVSVIVGLFRAVDFK